ncbi:hypothetical protein VP01_918g1, partial [Puccinia sorghi]
MNTHQPKTKTLELFTTHQLKTAACSSTFPSLIKRSPKSKKLSTPSSLPDDSNDQGKPFTPEDYENLCTYLEDDKNYTSLFGDGSKTAISVKQMTKSQSYEVFPTWMNQLNTDLHLNSRRLQQQIDRWKKKLRPKNLKRTLAGAGIEDKNGPHSLYDTLEKKSKINSMFEFDHYDPHAKISHNDVGAMAGDKSISSCYDPVTPSGTRQG